MKSFIEEIKGLRLLDFELEEVEVAGTIDPVSGALVRADGKTGRAVWMVHDPAL